MANLRIPFEFGKLILKEKVNFKRPELKKLISKSQMHSANDVRNMSADQIEQLISSRDQKAKEELSSSFSKEPKGRMSLEKKAEETKEGVARNPKGEQIASGNSSALQRLLLKSSLGGSKSRSASRDGSENENFEEVSMLNITETSSVLKNSTISKISHANPSAVSLEQESLLKNYNSAPMNQEQVKRNGNDKETQKKAQSAARTNLNLLGNFQGKSSLLESKRNQGEDSERHREDKLNISKGELDDSQEKILPKEYELKRESGRTKDSGEWLNEAKGKKQRDSSNESSVAKAMALLQEKLKASEQENKKIKGILAEYERNFKSSERENEENLARLQEHFEEVIGNLKSQIQDQKSLLERQQNIIEGSQEQRELLEKQLVILEQEKNFHLEQNCVEKNQAEDVLRELRVALDQEISNREQFMGLVEKLTKEREIVLSRNQELEEGLKGIGEHVDEREMLWEKERIQLREGFNVAQEQLKIAQENFSKEKEGLVRKMEGYNGKMRQLTESYERQIAELKSGNHTLELECKRLTRNVESLRGRLEANCYGKENASGSGHSGLKEKDQYEDCLRKMSEICEELIGRIRKEPAHSSFAKGIVFKKKKIEQTIVKMAQGHPTKETSKSTNSESLNGASSKKGSHTGISQTSSGFYNGSHFEQNEPKEKNYARRSSGEMSLVQRKGEVPGVGGLQTGKKEAPLITESPIRPNAPGFDFTRSNVTFQEASQGGIDLRDLGTIFSRDFGATQGTLGPKSHTSDTKKSLENTFKSTGSSGTNDQKNGSRANSKEKGKGTLKSALKNSTSQFSSGATGANDPTISNPKRSGSMSKLGTSPGKPKAPETNGKQHESKLLSQ